MNAHIIISLILLFSSTQFLLAKGNIDLENSIRNIISDKKAYIGVAVIINSSDTLCINNEEKYPMMSVFKFHQAVAVAKHLETYRISLDSTLFINKNELNPDTYSPLYQDFPNQDIYISIENLLNYTLQLSDNNACDILFKHIISPQKTDSIIRSAGISDFAISATENDMHKSFQKCYSNWSSPLASTELLNNLISDNLLSEKYKTFIIQSMLNATTGANRIPASLTDKGAKIGHKTGTSEKNENGEYIGINDIGFIFMPNGNQFCISIFIKDAKEELTECEYIISKIAETVYNFIESKND